MLAHPSPLYFMTSPLKEKLEILEKLDETVLESIENDAETDKEIQESSEDSCRKPVLKLTYV